MRSVSIGGARRALALVVGVLASLMGLLSGVAVGREPVRTDPQAGSPAGVIYAIPLDSGRRDAAPVLPVGSRHDGPGGGAAAGGGGSAGGGSGSGGASAAASGGGPGAGAGSGGSGVGASARGALAAESASATTGTGTPSDPSSIHSENGYGSSSQVPGVSPAALQIGAGVPAAHTAGSTLPSYLLMVLIGLAAVSVGLIASRPHGEPK
jgi:hypothetical protein